MYSIGMLETIVNQYRPTGNVTVYAFGLNIPPNEREVHKANKFWK